MKKRTSVALFIGLLALSATAQGATNLYARLWEFLALPRTKLSIGFVIDNDSGLRPQAERDREQRDARAWPAALPRVQDDPARLLQIGSALESVRRTNEAREVRERALRICQQHWATDTNSITGRLNYASALGELERKAEQEQVLAEGLALAPKEWRYHAAMADFHLSQAAKVVHFNPGTPPARPLSASERRSFEEHSRRARQTWTNTWLHAGDAGEAHFKYAEFLASERCLPIRLSMRENLRFDTNGLFEAYLGTFFLPEVLDHLRRSLEGSTDPLAVAAVGYFGAIGAASVKTNLPVKELMQKAAEGDVPKASRDAAAAAVSRLSALAAQLPAAEAAEAFEFKGTFELIFLRDEAAAFASARRAVTLAPERDSARQFWLALHVGDERWDEALRLVEQRLQREDSAEWRFFATRLLDKLNRFSEAKEQVQKALQLDPSYAPAKISEIAYVVRGATNLSSLVKAKMALTDGNKFLKETETAADHPEWMQHWLTLQTYAVAAELLADHIDHAENALRFMLSYRPDYEPGRKLEKLVKEIAAENNATP